MTELFKRCDNCRGENRLDCAEEFQFTVGIEGDLSDGKEGFEIVKMLGTPERLDVNAAVIQSSRDQLEECLRIIGCTLTREQIDQNVTALKG